MVERISRLLPRPDDACLLAFRSPAHERALALHLGVPLHASDPDLARVGTKSGARRPFREAGVPVPAGLQDLPDDKIKARPELRAAHPRVDHAIVKLNDGYSARGNALHCLRATPTSPTRLLP
ncbi:hypothetical protein [Streptomyces chartreusis]|uniref:hypothetical protein n=1 Tax=Streptomyces chartreusis TaxID=1969 RepID=UPI002E175556